MLIRTAKIMSGDAASNIRDEATDRMIVDFYAREQNFPESCRRRGIALGMVRAVNVARTAPA